MRVCKTILLMLALGGCANTAATVQTVESDIQQGTAALCSFVPTLETIDAVAAAITGSVAGVGAVEALVGTDLTIAENTICAGMTPAVGARLPRPGSAFAGHAYTLHYSNGLQVPINGWVVH